ncbi:hypothetical protein KM759_gp086 [Lymphocystis disease virus 4]|uniref:Uncharacterized protein n=1 Tax=Lymphocystis disease virus 4 TaxID=2704413 RepID=A0A6B9XMY1_9VIRU|nr:hypothetical protein KM759_gp086 [Lymphocystis disease virus 4]QHR78452.1 hypothetical protein [Lymphocystis disease virus 4]
MSLLQAVDKTKNIPNFTNPQYWNGPQRILKPKSCKIEPKHAGFKKIEPLKKLGHFRPEGVLTQSYSQDPHRLQTGYIQKTTVYNGFEESVFIFDENRPTAVLDHPLSVKRNDKAVEKCENIKKPVRYFDVLKDVCLKVFETLTYKSVKFCSDNKLFLKTSLKTEATAKPFIKSIKPLEQPSNIHTKKAVVLPVKSGEKSFIKSIEVVHHNVKPKAIESSVLTNKSSVRYDSKDESYDLKPREDCKTSRVAGKTTTTVAYIEPPQKIKVVDRLTVVGQTALIKIKEEPVLGFIDLKTNPVKVYGTCEEKRGEKIIYTAVPKPTDRLKIEEKCIPHLFEKIVSIKPIVKNKTKIPVVSHPMEQKMERSLKIRQKGKLKRSPMINETSGCVSTYQTPLSLNPTLKHVVKNSFSAVSGHKLNEKPVKTVSKSLPCNNLKVTFNLECIKPGNVEVNGCKKLIQKPKVECFELNPHKFLTSDV